MSKFPEKLDKKLRKRIQENAFRTVIPKTGLVDFSSNDYLGFAGEKQIALGAEEIVNNRTSVRNGATGSRLLSGSYDLYHQLENQLSSWYDAESALVFNSGYDANLGFFSTVPQRGDVILYDELCHASIRDGVRLSDAKSLKFKHNDLSDLKLIIERVENNHQGEIYVVTESVFSMDGDSPEFKALIALCQKKKLYLIVDEAHAVGVFEKGLISQWILESHVFARIITFGKAFGAHGSAVLGSRRLKDFLINFCRSFIYTTGLPPHTLATVMAAHNFFKTEAGRKSKEKLQHTIDYFRSEVERFELRSEFKESFSAIQVCTISGNDRTKELSGILEQNGFDVRPILSPTVPLGQERLRFCLHSFNSKKEIDEVLEIVKIFLNEE